jgi:DNA-binding GntR family transcriptional regulator
MLTSRSLHQTAKKVTSLADQVHEYLRHAIISGELAPGEKLVELDIARRMSTSQGPVREALQRLERDGLVERKARSATFVTSLLTDEMYELFAVRAEIERFTIRHTAQCITSEQCDTLEEMIQAMRQAAGEGNLIRLAEYDLAFHRSIIEWSGRGNLLRAWTPLSHQVERFIVQTHPIYFPDSIEIAMRHNDILNPLKNHDAEGAAQAIQEHIMLIWPIIKPDDAKGG